MGVLDDLSSGLEGLATTGTDAAIEAARIQAQGATEGIDELREAREQARADLDPFRQQGAGLAPGLANLLTDKGAQRDFLAQNPFFKPLAEKAQQDIFASQAARGKVGSGETGNILQNKLLQIGSELLNKNITQRQNLVALGSNAASGQATGGLSTASGITDLLTGSANAQAAGIVGAQNAQTQRNQTIATTALSIFASDERVKEDIEQIGTHKSGLPIYTFKYKPDLAFKYGWDTEHQIGFMAQEVQEMFPEYVYDIDGILHIDYGSLLHAH